MAKMREIKGRLRAVGNIRRITRTMQMIATSRFQAVSRRATATKPYTQKIAEMVGNLAAAAKTGEEGSGFDHPLLNSPAEPKGRDLLLVITSTRGLCGGYNAGVLRNARRFLNDRADQKVSLEVVGRKGINYLRFAGYDIAQAHTHFSDEPAYEDVAELARNYMQRFTDGQIDSVHIAYMKFISNARQQPHILNLLPLEPPVPADGEQKSYTPDAGYDFSPQPKQLLSELLPVTVITQLFQAFNDAAVSEQIARMVAMKSATDNADQMQKDLRRSFNRARQSQITTELNEVVSGAQALG